MKESKDLPSKSSVSWREIAKGKKAPTNKNSSQKVLKKTLGFKYNIGAYVRLSPSDEIREEGSLVSHPQRIENFVKMKNSQDSNWGKIVELYVDKDYSGKDMNRPAFKKMCQDIKTGKINAVMVTELSRLSRNVKDFCQFWEFLKEHNTKFFSLKENFDTSTAIGELMVIQSISFAQFERKTIVERIKSGVRARAERGLTSGGHPILGLNLDPVKKCHLLVNEEEKTQVKFIFEKFLELGTISKLQHFLNEEGYRTKSYTTKAGKQTGGNSWTQSSLYGLLTNLSYTGKREINKMKRHLNQETLPQEEHYQIVKAHWPSLISEEIFYGAQEQLEANKKRSFKNIHIYRISELLYCGLCGEKLCGQSSTGRDGIKYFYYGHKRKILSQGEKHKERCELERIPAVKIEEVVIDRIGRLSQDRKLLAQIVQESQPNKESNQKILKNLIASKEQERRKVQQEREGLLPTLAGAKSSESREFVLERIEELTQSYKNLEDHLQKLKAEKTQASQNVVHMEDYFVLLQKFRSNFATKPSEEQKSLLRDFIKQIVVTKESLCLEYYGRGSTSEVIENKDFLELNLLPLERGSYSDTGAYSNQIGGGAGS